MKKETESNDDTKTKTFILILIFLQFWKERRFLIRTFFLVGRFSVARTSIDVLDIIQIHTKINVARSTKIFIFSFRSGAW